MQGYVVRLVTTQDQLIIQLTKRESVYAFRRKLSIPKSSIISVAQHKSFRDWPQRMLRFPGSYLPGVIMAGSYYSPRGWDFLYAHKPNGWTRPELRNVLVITTDRSRFRRIILSRTEAEAKELQAWLRTA